MDLDLVDKCVSLVGKRCSGKSCLLKYLLEFNTQKFDRVYCFCPTEKINNFYSDLIDDDNIFENYCDDWGEKFIQIITKANTGKPKQQHKKVLLILDDCFSDLDAHNSTSLKKIYTRGRHLSVSILVTCQHLHHIPPVARVNSDYMLVSQLNKASLSMLCDEFCSSNVTKDEFVKLYTEATKNYGFFVINQNSTRSGSIDEVYGCIRVPKEYIDSL